MAANYEMTWDELMFGHAPDPRHVAHQRLVRSVIGHADGIKASPGTREMVISALTAPPGPEVTDRRDRGMRMGLFTMPPTMKAEVREALGVSVERRATGGSTLSEDAEQAELERETYKARLRIRADRTARQEIAQEDLAASDIENEWQILPLESFDEASPTPDIGKRSDGEAAFYRGKLNAVFGESESAKTWLALIALVQVIRDGGRALMIDFEDSGQSIRSRLRTLGLTEAEEPRFLYLNPSTAPTEEQKDSMAEVLPTVDIALIDATSEALAAYGLSSNSDVDVAKFYAELPKWISRQGPAVVLIDHVPKSADNRSGQTGSQHKRAGVDGCSLYVERVVPFAKGLGRSRVWVNKDKHAGVRNTASADGLWAELINDTAGFQLIDPTAGPTHAELMAARAERNKVRAMDLIKLRGPFGSMNKARIVMRGDGLRGSDSALNEILGALIAEGCITNKIEFVKDYLPLEI